MTRVVITGIGVLSPVGNGRDEFWAGLVAGRSGLGPITLFDASGFPVRIGGEVKNIDVAAIRRAFPAAARCRDRKVLLGVEAGRGAVLDCGLDEEAFRAASLHVGVGLEMLCLEDLTPFADADDIGPAMARQLPGRLGGQLLQTPLDSTAEALGERYGFLGGRFTNCSACAAGAQSVGEALRLLRRGDVGLALAGATDSMLNPLGLGGFSLLRVLSAENDDPRRACRPFDASRRGTALGEGAAFLVLEPMDRAQGRGARIYAELLGYGSSMDGFRVSDPEPGGKGAVCSMKAAMADARLGPGQIDCVNAHGTGTPKNDVVETGAIKEALGVRAYDVPVHAVKSMTGHMIAASGAVEAAAAALTLSEQRVPPTINLEQPDPECDLDYVPGRARPFHGGTVLSNSFGFGGQNATLIFGEAPVTDLDAFLEILRSRRSVRAFADRAPERAVLDRLFEAARWAPSNHNRQGWKFLVFREAAIIRELASRTHSALAARLTSADQPWASKGRELLHFATLFEGAPVLILAMHKKPLAVGRMLLGQAPAGGRAAGREGPRREAPVSAEALSAAMAVQNLLLAAHAAGLGACVMTAPLLAGEVWESIPDLPAGFEPTCLVAVGYAAERPAAPRRKPLEHLVEYR